MKNFTKVLLVVSLGFGLIGSTMAATAPNLGAVAGYAIYSDAGVTNFGGVTTTHIRGNVGHNGLGATNLATPTQVVGTIDAGVGVATVMNTAYLALLAEGTTVPVYDLAGNDTIGPGVYDVAATTLDGTLTLSGAGVYIFKGSSVTVNAPGNMVLTNGADACNVFWALTTRMHVSAGAAHVIGTVITAVGGADITFGDGASLQGRAWAHTAITLRNNVITEPTCTVVPPSGGSFAPSRLIPLINILKVPTPLVLIGSGLVTYNYTVQNVGLNLALRNITVNDDTCGPVVYISGDVNNDGRLELTEKWYYRCTTTLSATTTNIVTVYGESDDSYRDVATDTATATVVVGAVVVDTGVHAAPLTPPLINIIKIPNRLTPFPFGGGDVTYTYTVTNPGIVAMNDIVVTDDKCGPIALIGGDTNYDHLLDINESWVYTCQSNISVSTRNVAIAEGKANGFIVQDQTFANVYVTPGLPKTGLSITPWHIIVLASILMIISTSLIFVFKKKTI